MVVANAKARADDSVLRVASVSFLFQCATLDNFYEIGAAVAHLTFPFYAWSRTMVSPLVKFATSTWIYAKWRGKVYLKQIPKDFVMCCKVWESIRVAHGKARGILYGLVGEKKIVLYSTESLAGGYFMAELAGDYAGLIPSRFPRENKVGGGGPD